MQNNEEKKTDNFPTKKDVETHFEKYAKLPLILAVFILVASVIIGVVMSIIYESGAPCIPWCVGGFVAAVTVAAVLRIFLSTQTIVALRAEKLNEELKALKSQIKDKE